jgi:hypothetical protein
MSRGLAPKTLRSGCFCFFRPNDGSQKSAIRQSLRIVRKRALQCQHVPSRQINYLVLHMHSDLACDRPDRNPTGGFMFVTRALDFRSVSMTRFA